MRQSGRWWRSVEISIAVYGAIVGTVAVGWQIYQQARQVPDLKIGVIGTSFSTLRAAGGDSVVMDIKLPVVNLGPKPAVLYTVHVDLSDVSPESRGSPALTGADPYVREELPLTLPANDVRMLTIVVGFTCKCQTMPANASYTGTLNVDLNTSAGRLDWTVVPPIFTDKSFTVSNPMHGDERALRRKG